MKLIVHFQGDTTKKPPSFGRK